jgi:GTP-binding protein
MTSPSEDNLDLEAGRLLFAGPCDFVRGVTTIEALPGAGLPEIAFAGRSNVGKSSLINALTNRKTLARTSNTPGRTREINFFDLGKQLYLVDLPGFGYARVSKTEVKNWTRLVTDYLKGRVELRRVCLLVDARRGFLDSDQAVMETLDVAAVSYQIVLTKSDKLKPGVLASRVNEVEGELRCHPAAYPQVLVTSAVKGHGIPELRSALASLANE